MPNLPVHRNYFEIHKELLLADPVLDETQTVDLFLGAGIFWKLLCVGQIHLRSGQPILQKNQLGWIIPGPMQIPSRDKRAVCNSIPNKQLHNEVQKFREMKFHKINRSYPDLEARDDLGKHVMLTTRREVDGRFVVTLPLKEHIFKFGKRK